MDEDAAGPEQRGEAEEPLWEVNEYRHETPALLALLFSPAGGLPVAFAILFALWKWLGPD